MKKNLALILAIIFAVSIMFTACAPKVQQQPQPPKEQAEQPAPTPVTYVNDDLLVSADWVKENLSNIIILDARDENAYKAGHITGAINAPWQPFTDMKDKKPGDKGWGILLPADEIGKVIGNLGIDGTKTVVVYAAPPKGWGEDGRVAWTLKSAGIKDVKILNGGIDAWKSKGYSTDGNIVTPSSVEYTANALDGSLNATTEWINSNLGKIKIIDVREINEYNGDRKYGEARGGHLPGAVNITWSQVFNADGTVKNQQELEKLFTEAGIGKEDEIVTYCTKGIRSAHTALILRMAGYEKAKNYDASFYEWAGDESLKLE